MRHRANKPPRRWEMISLAAVLVLTGTAGVYEYNRYAAEQRQIQAAEQLIAESSQRAELPEVSAPVAIPQPTPSASPATAEPAPPGGESAPPVVDTAPTLPITQFDWPAVGLSIDVVPMAWQPGQVVNPGLDANGFDPVAHLLEGSGESEALQPLVLAAHTCTSTDKRLCNDATFPFMRLSYDGWAVGQPASAIDATGRAINYTLVDRKVVDKSKAFSFANDRCLLVAFTCNLQNPEGEITLVTFRRTGCGA